MIIYEISNWLSRVLKNGHNIRKWNVFVFLITNKDNLVQVAHIKYL